MLSFLRALADAVDRLSAAKAATVTETQTALTISALSAPHAEALAPLLVALGWAFEFVDNAGEHVDPSRLTADYAPFIATVRKPQQGAALQVVTHAGLRAFLTAERAEEAWEVATLSEAFMTMATSFRPWGATKIFSPAASTKSPRQLVREHSIPPRAPSDIRIWLLRDPADEILWADPVFQVFADLSAQALMRGVSGEIEASGRLIFKGPPHTQLEAPQPGAAEDLERDGYNDLRSAAAWIYESSAEAEQRHGLFTAEFGRTHPPIATAALAFSRVVANVLKGARLAYQLSLSDLTREAIKAQGDLRKAIADDTAKLADNTRQVATAVATALATCIGLVAAKIGTSTPPWVIQTGAGLAAVYAASVIVSGYLFMNVQRDMRRKWRTRLYRFVPDDDYKAMVLDPVGRAEAMFIVAAVAGGLIALGSMAIVLLI